MEFLSIESGARPGPENMALDARLLDEACATGAFFFHSYAWSRPTLSLGYFQKLEDVAQDASRVEVVRRFTGGGAILHDRELTFSLAVPPGHPVAGLEVEESYLELARPLLFWLRGLGLAAGFRGQGAPSKGANCFAGSACPDIVVGGKKIFGSAQRRKNGAILQQGSLLLDIDTGLWQAVFGPRLGQGFTCVRAEGLDPSQVDAEGLKQAYQAAWRVPFKTVQRAWAG